MSASRSGRSISTESDAVCVIGNRLSQASSSAVNGLERAVIDELHVNIEITLLQDGHDLLKRIAHLA